MTDEEIKHVCEEANMLNLKVASHTSGGRGITTAVKNGIHSVEHGHWLDNETIDLMAKNNTFYVPFWMSLQEQRAISFKDNPR